MKLGKETKVDYCKFDVEFENNEFQILKDYGLKKIQEDDEALVNYAVNKILIDQINASDKCKCGCGCKVSKGKKAKK